LFVTRADSRVDPSLITQSKPRQLFVDRNPSEAAGIEYALKVLKIPNIIICGHTDCGAMKAVLHPEKVKDLPAVSRWLRNGKDASRRVTAMKLPEDQQLEVLTQQNVIVQLEHLRKYPVVQESINSAWAVGSTTLSTVRCSNTMKPRADLRRSKSDAYQYQTICKVPIIPPSSWSRMWQ
jgi:carbonic anhydrase